MSISKEKVEFVQVDDLTLHCLICDCWFPLGHQNVIQTPYPLLNDTECIFCSVCYHDLLKKYKNKQIKRDILINSCLSRKKIKSNIIACED